tara:strand:+ start:416 stop:2311 length:1896 start_codon:yes stop_codon:yes gene_type:complete
MPLQKFIFNPGINKEGTDYTAEGGWFDGNLVRFRKGLPEKIGGWVKYITASFVGTGRKLFGWTSLAGTKLLGVGTTKKLYIQAGTNYNDITPLRATTAAGDVTFGATNGSSSINVTDTAHGAAQGDFVTFSGAASLGGNVVAAVLNQEYEIDSITSTSVYVITAKDTSGATVTANSSDSGNGGSSTVGAYQINIGLDVFVSGTGWGASTWGAGGWGSSSPLSSLNQLRLWSMDSFGEDLLANVRAGRIYYWDTSAKTLGTDRAVDIADLTGANFTPTAALQVLVSDVDRHVIALGADPINDAATARTGTIDPLLIAFSDQENPAEWFPTATNTAGSLRCSAGSQIIGGLRARQETLVWTDVALYSLQFIGAPLTFGLNLINEGVSLVGPNAAINTPNGVFWMDKKGFYAYQGSVQPVPCSVKSYVLSDFNAAQAFQVFGFVNKQFDEVGWFYCSSTSDVIDRYVTYNYVEQTWAIGNLSRTAWLDEGIESFPRAAGVSSSNNYIFSHETGFDDEDSPMDNVFVESADFDLGDGEQFQFVRRCIPDVKFTGDSGTTQTLNFVLKARNFPGESLTTDQTTSFTSSTTKIDTRARGRQAAVRFESDDDGTTGTRLGVGFRIGGTRLDLQPNGRR